MTLTDALLDANCHLYSLFSD